MINQPFDFYGHSKRRWRKYQVYIRWAKLAAKE